MLRREYNTIQRLSHIPVSENHPILNTHHWQQLSKNWNNMLNYYAAPGLIRQADQINATIIFEKVSKYFDRSILAMTGRRKEKEVVMARQICQYIIRKKLRMPVKAIGKLFNRDHGTVCHSLKYIENQLSLKNPGDIVTHLINIENQLKW